MHDVGVVFACKDVPGPTHIRSELVDLVKPRVDHGTAEILVAEVTDSEIIRLRFSVLVEFQVDAANPETLLTQPSDQVAADETASAANQFPLHLFHPEISPDEKAGA
jgi:hypothetical protein